MLRNAQPLFLASAVFVLLHDTKDHQMEIGAVVLTKVVYDPLEAFNICLENVLQLSRTIFLYFFGSI